MSAPLEAKSWLRDRLDDLSASLAICLVISRPSSFLRVTVIVVGSYLGQHVALAYLWHHRVRTKDLNLVWAIVEAMRPTRVLVGFIPGNL